MTKKRTDILDQLSILENPWPVPENRPGELTNEQREGLSSFIEKEGFEYFFVYHTGIELFEHFYGSLPSNVVEAWQNYINAHDALEELLKSHGIIE